MQPAPDILSLEAIEKELQTSWVGRNLGENGKDGKNEVWQSVGSTNNRVQELASQGAPAGVFVAARQQTAGRGRLGRVWVSPPDAGVYMSVLFRPGDTPSQDLAPITLAFGVAASRAVEHVVGVRLGLKWVNDLVLDGKKIGGILAEMPAIPASDNGSQSKALILGCGLNVRLDPAEIPSELVDKMGWLEQSARSPVNPNLLAAQLLFELERSYDLLQAGKVSAILDEWRDRTVTLGKDVVVTSGTTSLQGRAIDIDKSGALLVQLDNGEISTVHAGEVTVRTADGSYV